MPKKKESELLAAARAAVQLLQLIENQGAGVLAEQFAAQTAAELQQAISHAEKVQAAGAACLRCGRGLTCPACTGSAGGKKSKRKITPEQQEKLQQARSRKK